MCFVLRKNCEPPEFGAPVLAIEIVPTSFDSSPTNSACYPVRETAWRLWVGEGPDPTPDESTGGGGKKGGGHPRKKRESRITWAVIFAVIVRARADIN